MPSPFREARQALAAPSTMCAMPASRGMEPTSQGDGRNELVGVALQNEGGHFFLRNPSRAFCQPCSISLRTKSDPGRGEIIAVQFCTLVPAVMNKVFLTRQGER